MNDLLRVKLCDIVAAHGPGVADDPRRCAELLRQAAPEDGGGVEALLRALEAHVPARLALLTEPLALAPLTSGLVRRLVDEQGLSEEAARWAVEAWAVALGKGNDGPSADRFSAYEHVLAPPRRRRRWLWLALPLLALLAVGGGWWWAAQRSEERRIADHVDGISCLAVSADGRTILASCGNREMILWDVATGAELGRFDGHLGPIRGVALSPDSGRALSCGGIRQRRDSKQLFIMDCLVRSWDVPSGQFRHFFGTGFKITEAALHLMHEARVPDTVLAKLAPLKDRRFSKPEEFGIEVRRLLDKDEWNRWNNAILSAAICHDYDVPIYCVAFSPDGRLALAGMGDYEFKDGKYVTKDDKPLPFECVVCLYDAQTGQELRRLEGHKAPVHCAVFSPDGRRVVSGSDDGTLRLWDTETGRELKQVTLNGKAHPMSLAVSPDGQWLLTGDDQARVSLWRLEELELEREQKGRGESVYVAFSPDGRRAVSGGDDFVVRLWDAETLTELRHFPGHTGPIEGVAFLADGRHVLSGSSDSTIRVWRLPP
jgi:WD40 repeat protein